MCGTARVKRGNLGDGAALSGVGGYLWLRQPTAPRIALYFARELALKAHS